MLMEEFLFWRCDMSSKRHPKKHDSASQPERKKQTSQGITSELGLTESQIEELYIKSLRLKEGWEAPGMEAYDNL
jgi:hypothetical protein